MEGRAETPEPERDEPESAEPQPAAEEEESAPEAVSAEPQAGPPPAETPPAEAPPGEAPPAPPQRKTSDERKQLLAQTIQTQVAGGARVESQGDFQAVLVRGHRPNHVLHLILTLITAGLWGLFVWLPIAIFGGEKRSIANVDEFGNVTLQNM
jgi:hypothetical protein